MCFVRYIHIYMRESIIIFAIGLVGLDILRLFFYGICMTLAIIPAIILFILKITVFMTLTRAKNIGKFVFISGVLLIFFIIAILSYTPSPPDVDTLYSCDPEMFEMDLVWTWVNVTDKSWQEKAKENGCDVEGYLSGGGDFDPFQELRFSLRSARKNMPFLRNIYIVTAFEQKPDWLIAQKNVHMIHHSQLLPKTAFPTFNSQPTEYSIANFYALGIIPDKCFLYLNDDFLVMKKLEISDFIDSQGRVKLYAYQHRETPFGWMDIPFGLNGYESDYLTDPHVPYLINAPIMLEAVSACDTCNEIFASKCSRKGRFFADFYQTALLNKYDHGIVRFISPIEGFFNRAPLGLTSLSLRNNLKLIEWLDPKFVYIESHDDLENREGALELVKGFLTNSFPDSAPWEKSL